jgi:hypothetical protein
VIEEQLESESNEHGISQVKAFAELPRVSSVQDMGRPFILFLGRGPESINILRANIEYGWISAGNRFRADGFVLRMSHGDIELILVGVKLVQYSP